MTETEIDNTEQARKAIDAFLVDNTDLENLSAKLSQFNLFHVLKAENSEIRHSNILAWLLDPNESHGLDDRFLRKFISKLLLENDEVPVSLRPANVELMDLSDAEVLREWKNIDILVKSGRNKLCLVIENKIRSRESRGQLQRYKASVDGEMSDFQVIPILLTLDGDDPSDDGREAGFVGLSHIHVLELLTTLLSQYSSRLPPDTHVLVEHYVRTLRRLTMQDDDLVELCKAIYRRHREAIDLIVQYGAASNVLDICSTTVKRVADLKMLHISRGRVWFVPSEMAKGQKPLLLGWPFLPERLPLVWWFHYKKLKAKLQLSLEVGPMADPAIRRSLLEQLRNAGFKISEKGFREEAKYTRIYTLTKSLQTNEDGEVDDSDTSIEKMTEDMWTKANADTSKIVEALKKFNWSPTRN